MTKQEFIKHLENYNISLKHHLGQNFIYNQAILENAIDTSFTESFQHVLEIGSGAASLTEVLSKRAKKVVSIEIDDNLFPLLEAKSKELTNVQFVFSDARKTDFSVFFNPEEKKDLVVVANLPYYISTDLISQSLLELPEAKAMLFLVQKDALPRLKGISGDGKSESKNQGWISKFIACYGNAKNSLTIPRDQFVPQPHIDSQFIYLEGNKNIEQRDFFIQNRTYILQTIQEAYSQRRKSLVNCFAAANKKLVVREWLEAQGIDLHVRAEALQTEDWFSLTRVLYL